MKKQLLSIHHSIVAFILITKGFDKIQNHHSFIGWTILLLGIIILIYFIFIKLSRKKHSLLELIIHLFESTALFLTTYVYFQEGKTLLPYVTLIAGIGFLIATFIHLIEHKKHSNENKLEQKATNR
jgi:FtsH-binding integral membrane protein